MLAHDWYGLQLSAVLLWWALIKAKTGKHLYSLCSSSVVTRPSWLPLNVLLTFASHKQPIFVALPVALLAGIFCRQCVVIRTLVALVVSVVFAVAFREWKPFFELETDVLFYVCGELGPTQVMWYEATILYSILTLTWDLTSIILANSP